MSEKVKKHPLNVRGKYYVDQDNCVWCATCIETAPNNFKLEDVNSDGAYVFKQPETSEEEKLCKEAVWFCPHEAIHNRRRRMIENAI